MSIDDTVDERHDEIESRLEHRVELAPSLDDPRALLRHDAYRLNNDDQHDNEQQEGEDRRSELHGGSEL